MRSSCNHSSFAWYFMFHNKWYGSCSVQHNSKSGKFIAILDIGIIQSPYLVIFEFSPKLFAVYWQAMNSKLPFLLCQFSAFFQLYKKARRLGYGESDISAVYRAASNWIFSEKVCEICSVSPDIHVAVEWPVAAVMWPQCAMNGVIISA